MNPLVKLLVACRLMPARLSSGKFRSRLLARAARQGLKLEATRAASMDLELIGRDVLATAQGAYLLVNEWFEVADEGAAVGKP